MVSLDEKLAALRRVMVDRGDSKANTYERLRGALIQARNEHWGEVTYDENNNLIEGDKQFFEESWTGTFDRYTSTGLLTEDIINEQFNRMALDGEHR